mgnify:CR=1 FL=1
MLRKIRIYQVDAFADQLFHGNPAGVCITAQALDDRLMQNIAMEMNLSETAFAVPLETRDVETCSNFSLRWFTPVQEVELCGHATLATAKVLFDICKAKSEKIRFQTQSGELVVSKRKVFCLDFPADPSHHVKKPASLLKSLGVQTAEDYSLSSSLKMLLIRLESKEEVSCLKPDFRLLAKFEQSYGNQGFIVTARDTEYDFVSRFFAPGVGINEDPVTGSAHTVLAPYWAEILCKKKMKACQISARQGLLDVELHGDRVYLLGQAIVVLEADLLL